MTALRVLVALCLAALGASAEAQTPLRWKLGAGDELRVQVTQATTSDVTFSGKQATTQIDLAVDLKWKVHSANDEQIRVQQTIERVQFKMVPAKGAAIAYDTDSQDRPTGAAKDIAAALQPFVGAHVQITMTPRGIIHHVVSPKEEDDPASTDASSSEGGISRSQIQQLLKQSLVVLPENPVKVGDTWTSGANIASAVGDFKQETRFELAEPVERGGRSLAKITSVTKLEPAAASDDSTSDGPAPAAAGGKTPTKPRVKSHEHTSAILFDAEQGRVVEAESLQKLVTERPYRETTIVVSLSSKQTTTIQVAGK